MGLLIPAGIIQEKASIPGFRLWQTGKKDPDSGFLSPEFNPESRLLQTEKDILIWDFHSKEFSINTQAVI